MPRTSGNRKIVTDYSRLPGGDPRSGPRSGSAPAEPFTRAGAGESEAMPDSGAGAAAVPAEKVYNLAELISAPMVSMAFMILRVVFSPG